MKLVEAVGLRTAELLKVSQKSQYRLIKDTCLSKNAVLCIIRNKSKDIKLSTIYLIADFFGMSLTEFFDCDYFKNIDIYG